MALSLGSGERANLTNIAWCWSNNARSSAPLGPPPTPPWCSCARFIKGTRTANRANFQFSGGIARIAEDSR